LRTLALVFTRHLGVPCYANFLDLKKAFPSVNRAATLKALMDLGVPYELVRAFASTFPLNSCRLVINGQLTGAYLPVKKGTKEGGINSPPIFNRAYVTVLRRLNISEFPDSPSSVDKDKVYYIVFADDLVLVTANLTRLEEETGKLYNELARLGMCINAEKTKWMMFLPPFPITVPTRESLRLSLGTNNLEMVQEFTYLEFSIDSHAYLVPHVRRREKLLISAATLSGRLMRQLEVTNLRSLRSYFYALVLSQLYGQSCVSFSSDAYSHPQKIFLQEAWNLPRSFPIKLATFLLGCEDLEAIALRARLRYVQHLLSGKRTKASLSALILDRFLLLPRRVGWSHEIGLVTPSVSSTFDVRTMDLTNSSQTRALMTDLARNIAVQIRESHTSTSSHHILSLVPTLSIPHALGEILGELSFESVRVFIRFMANLTRFCSITYPRNRPCPFCDQKMYTQHFFDCEQYNDLGDVPVSWEEYVGMFVRREWLDAISSTIRRLAGWSRRTNIFRENFHHRVDEYYEELVWLRDDRIRRSGGASPLALQWSVVS
jgi:hypothetical protein